MPDSDIAPAFLAKAWLFQAILAGPTFVVLGFCAMLSLWDDGGSYWSIYDFVTLMCTSIMAGGIIFLAVVQRQLARDAGTADVGRRWALGFEAGKSLLGTGLWIWLMADSLWGPGRSHWSPGPRERRIACATVSVNLLFVFFYPTLAYAFLSQNRNEAVAPAGGPRRAGGEDTERTPLLATQEEA